MQRKKNRKRTKGKTCNEYRKVTYVNFIELSFEEEERLLQLELSNRIGSRIQNLVSNPDPVIEELLPGQTLDRHQQSQKPNTARKSHYTALETPHICAFTVTDEGSMSVKAPVRSEL